MRCFDVSVFDFFPSPTCAYIIGRKPIAFIHLTHFIIVLHFFTKKSSFLSYIFGAERQKCIKRVKNAKNVLDKHIISCYNIASRLERRIFITTPKKISKKVKKLSKKVLTSGKWCGIISKSLRKLRQTVIENWTTREKYKAIKNSMCIGSRTILNKRILLKQK